jgi:hypothetical protein
MNMLELLILIRGGLPETCDFCGLPYGDGRYPVPEEAGAWSCNECEAKFDALAKFDPFQSQPHD